MYKYLPVYGTKICVFLENIVVGVKIWLGHIHGIVLSLQPDIKTMDNLKVFLLYFLIHVWYRLLASKIQELQEICSRDIGYVGKITDISSTVFHQNKVEFCDCSKQRRNWPKYRRYRRL